MLGNVLCKSICIKSAQCLNGWLLWKTLWIMWKTNGFQQVIFRIAGEKPCFAVYNRLHNR